MDVKFTDNSRQFLEDLKQKIPLALEAIGMTAERYAKKETQVDTGRLRNSITYATSGFSGIGSYSDNKGNHYSDAKANGNPKENEVYIGTNVEYAPYIELGARGRKAHHMLGKAATEHSDEYKQIAKKVMKSD